MASSVKFNTSNLWDDLKVLSESRANGNKSLLCLYNGKLDLSLIPRDTREEKRNYGIWAMGWASSFTRTIGNYLWSDNDTNNVIKYLNELVAELYESLKNIDSLKEKQITILAGCFESLENFADEYSAKEERRIGNGLVAKESELKSNIEGDGKNAKDFLDLADRIKSFAIEHNFFSKLKK
ncbi:MAG: hypothetical protein WCT85_01950 [Parachlamydiales bacterium]|jgi:iron uptake system EfeUOB component EfeO/EfeM